MSPMPPITDEAVAQAIGLCWLARQRGLPVVHSLRMAVAQLHATPCGWCGFPDAALIAMLEDAEVAKSTRDAFWRLPGRARLALIERAADRDVVA